MSDLISRQGALAKIRTRLQDWAAYGNEEYRRGLYACEDMIISLPSAEPKTGECSGCKFIGSYDMDFPCVNCVRKTKDYYCGERMRGEDGEE